MGCDTVKTVSKSSFSFLSGTLLSRVTGALRDMAMAFCFGSSASLASFMVAYRFASLSRRLFGEAPISSGFVPHFEALRKESKGQGYLFFRDLFFSLTFFLLIIIGLAELVLWGVYHFGSMPEGARQITALCLIMLPGALFLCLFGLTSSLLQCEKNFFLPGFAPVAFNVVWILSVLFLRNQSASHVATWLSIAMILAFFVHWAVLLPKMVFFLKSTLSWRQIFSPHLFSEDVKKMIQPFFLGILGAGAAQINSALDAIFSRFASLEAPAYLWYAIRLQQVPLGLFGVALSTALLPSLSRSFAAMDLEKYKDLLGYGLKKTFSLMFPATLALFVLGAVGVNFVYGRGGFSGSDTYNTLLCLWGYALGLIPTAYVMLLAPAFYAKKNFRTPMIASTLSVCINVLLNYLFVFHFHLGAISIALATSIAAFANMFVLTHFLQKRIGSITKTSILKDYAGVVLCSLFAAFVTLLLGHFLLGDPTVSIMQGSFVVDYSRHFITQLLEMFVLLGFFALLLISYAWVFGVRDILSLVGIKKNDVDTSLSLKKNI